MTTPQLENGYTKIANEILDALSANRIPGEQMQCLMVIIRKTYGYHAKEAGITNAEFSIITGLKRPSVCRAINGLIDKNIVSKKANNTGITYSFNKNYRTWKLLAKKLMLAKKLTVVSKKANDPLAKKLTAPIKETRKKNKIYITANFEKFYEAYPLKKEKQAALKAWKKHNPPIEKCLEAIEAQKKEKTDLKSKGLFCPEWKHPATWINKGCWEDEIINPETDDWQENEFKKFMEASK